MGHGIGDVADVVPLVRGFVLHDDGLGPLTGASGRHKLDDGVEALTLHEPGDPRVQEQETGEVEILVLTSGGVVVLPHRSDDDLALVDLTGVRQDRPVARRTVDLGQVVGEQGRGGDDGGVHVRYPTTPVTSRQVPTHKGLADEGLDESVLPGRPAIETDEPADDISLGRGKGVHGLLGLLEVDVIAAVVERRTQCLDGGDLPVGHDLGPDAVDLGAVEAETHQPGVEIDTVLGHGAVEEVDVGDVVHGFSVARRSPVCQVHSRNQTARGSPPPQGDRGLSVDL